MKRPYWLEQKISLELITPQPPYIDPQDRGPIGVVEWHRHRAYPGGGYATFVGYQGIKLTSSDVDAIAEVIDGMTEERFLELTRKG